MQIVWGGGGRRRRRRGGRRRRRKRREEEEGREEEEEKSITFQFAGYILDVKLDLLFLSGLTHSWILSGSERLADTLGSLRSSENSNT